MTDNELLKKVLEHEGWTEVRMSEGGQWFGNHPVKKKLMLVPNLLTDRNAVAELVLKLKFAQLEQWGQILIIMRDPSYEYEIVLVAPNIQLRAWWEVVENE